MTAGGRGFAGVQGGTGPYDMVTTGVDVDPGAQVLLRAAGLAALLLPTAPLGRPWPEEPLWVLLSRWNPALFSAPYQMPYKGNSMSLWFSTMSPASRAEPVTWQVLRNYALDV